MLKETMSIINDCFMTLISVLICYMAIITENPTFRSLVEDKEPINTEKKTKNIKGCIFLSHSIVNKYLLNIHHVSDITLCTKGPGI